MPIRALHHTLICLIVTGAISTVPAAEAGSAYSATVGEQVITKNILGIGWNLSAVRGGPTGRGWPEHAAGRAFTEAEWDRWFDLLAWSGVDLLRHGFWAVPGAGGTVYEPTNDNDDPFVVDDTKFHFDSPHFAAHNRYLAAYQKRQIPVLLTHWKNHAPWNGTKKTEKWREDGEEYHPKSDDEYAEGAVRYLRHLLDERKYTNITHFSMWNEPNGSWAYKGRYSRQWWPLVPAFDKQLKLQGLRERIRFVAPEESYETKSQTHIPKAEPKFGKHYDVVAIHDYFSQSAILGEPEFKDLGNIRQAVGDKPIIISEYGRYRAGRPKHGVGNDQNYRGGLSVAHMILHHFNHGAAGFLRWAYNLNQKEATCSWNAVLANTKTHVFTVNDPVYFTHAIHARYVRAGWQVLQLGDEQGGTDAEGHRRVRLAALTDGKNHCSLLLVNDNDQAHPVSITVPADWNARQLNQLVVTGPTSGIVAGKAVTVTEARVRVTLAPRSLVSLTTLPPGDLEAPRRLVLPKAATD